MNYRDRVHILRNAGVSELQVFAQSPLLQAYEDHIATLEANIATLTLYENDSRVALGGLIAAGERVIDADGVDEVENALKELGNALLIAEDFL